MTLTHVTMNILDSLHEMTVLASNVMVKLCADEKSLSVVVAFLQQVVHNPILQQQVKSLLVSILRDEVKHQHIYLHTPYVTLFLLQEVGLAVTETMTQLVKQQEVTEVAYALK